MQTPSPAALKKIRILVVDGCAVIRRGLAAAASDAADMEVVAAAESGEQAIEAYGVHRPDLVVIDLLLPGTSGWETIRQLREKSTHARILIFSDYARSGEMHRALKAGAAGVVLKGMPLERLLEAIRAVHAGGRYVPPEVALQLGEPLLAQLSPREIDVLNLLASGLSNKEMALQLKVVEGTVKCHIASIFGKLGVSDRTQALIESVKRGIVQIV